MNDQQYTAPCDGYAWATCVVSENDAYFNLQNVSTGLRGCNHVYSIGYNSDVLMPAKKGDRAYANSKSMNVKYINFYKTNAED